MVFTRNNIGFYKLERNHGIPIRRNVHWFLTNLSLVFVLVSTATGWGPRSIAFSCLLSGLTMVHGR